MISRGSLLVWLAVGAVGVGLGLSTLAVAVFPPRLAFAIVLAVLSPFIAMMVGNIRRLMLALIMIDIPFQLDVNLGYRNDVGALGAIGGVSISATTGALFVLYGLWVVRLLCRVGDRPAPVLRSSLPLALYIAADAFSMLVARDASLALFELLLLLQSLLLYIFITSTVRDREDLLFIVTMLLIVAMLESLVMIGVYASGHDLRLPGISTKMSIDYGGRAGGTLGSPNAAGAYLSLLLAPAMGMLLVQLGRKSHPVETSVSSCLGGEKLPASFGHAVLAPVGRLHRQVAALTLGLGGVAIVLTLSRGAWMALAISGLIVGLLAWYRGWLSLKLPAALAAILGLLALWPSNPILTRLLAEDGGSARGRIMLARFAARVIEDHPLRGVGANNFALIIKQYATPDFADQWLYIVHNKYLLVWSETGIVGLACFLLFLLTTIYKGLQCWRADDLLLAPLALGFTAAIIGHMTHMLVDFFNMRPDIQLLWLMAALIAVMGRMASTPGGATRRQTQTSYQEVGSVG